MQFTFRLSMVILFNIDHTINTNTLDGRTVPGGSGAAPSHGSSRDAGLRDARLFVFAVDGACSGSSRALPSLRSWAPAGVHRVVSFVEAGLHGAWCV